MRGTGYHTAGILLVVTLVIYRLWIKKSGKCNPNEPPLYTSCLPLIGHGHRLIGNSNHLWELIEKEVNVAMYKLDGVIRIKLGPVTSYIISDPDDCLTVSNACIQKASFYDFLKPWLGEGLLTANVPIWRVHRKMLGPAFSQAVVDGFLGVFNKYARLFVDDLAVEDNGAPFNHWVYIRNNLLQTICYTAMGVEDYSDISSSANKYSHAMEQMLDSFITRFQRIWLHHPSIFNFSGLKKKTDEAVETLHDISNMILKKRKAEYLENEESELKNVENTGGAKFKSFMELLLQLSIVKGELNDQEIREETDTMIFAGHETTATVMLFTMLMVASYPRVQERLYKELLEVLGDDDRDITKQDLTKLVYLNAVIKETMRVYSPVPLVIRHLDKDIKLRNCTLSAGRSCFLSLHGIHHHPMWGPDVEEFKPERWLDPASLPQNAINFVGFSLGRRTCAGQLFALMSMKIILATVVRRYKLKGDHTKLKLKLDMFLKPISGHHISIKSRNNNVKI